MAGVTMRVDVVSPERILFSGEATMVVTRTMGGGDIAFMPGHAPFLAALIESHTRLFLADGSVQNVAVHGGFVEVGPKGVSILTDVAELGEEIDVTRAERARDAAESALAHEHDAEVEGSLRRAHARLQAAGGIDSLPGR
jgi:F-type H+-transporting ATPase subunit epsilon